MQLRQLLFCLMAGVCVSLPAMAQVDYRNGQPWSQRAGDGPDAIVPGWYYNLGITGVRAELVADDPKALLVRYVFEKSPAGGLVKVDDRIVGVNGKTFEHPHRNGYGMAVFGGDGPIKELASVLEACTGEEGSGKLVLKVKRGSKLIDVELKFSKAIGSYSATFPSKCPKSERIYKHLLNYLVEHQHANGSFGSPVENTFAPLALLASGEKRYLPNIERCARHLSDGIPDSANDRKDGLMNWSYMAAAIVLSEYHLATKAQWVLPKLQKIHDVIYQSQYMDMSQINPKAKESHPDSYPTGPKSARGGWGHNPGFEGYGPMTMTTGQGAMAYALMNRCGIKIDRARLEAAYDFLKRGTAPNGCPGYADSSGGGDDWCDLGRAGAAGMAFALCPYDNAPHRQQALLYSNIIGKHPQSFPDTHASPIMGMGYEAMGANIDPKNFRKLMDDNRWWFTMAQCADDGTFYYQPNRDSSGYGGDSRMSATAVVAFIYSFSTPRLQVQGVAVLIPGVNHVALTGAKAAAYKAIVGKSYQTAYVGLKGVKGDDAEVAAMLRYIDAQWEKEIGTLKESEAGGDILALNDEVTQLVKVYGGVKTFDEKIQPYQKRLGENPWRKEILTGKAYLSYLGVLQKYKSATAAKKLDDFARQNADSIYGKWAAAVVKEFNASGTISVSSRGKPFDAAMP